MNNFLSEAKTKTDKAYDFLADELRTIRTGRAMPSLVDELEVTVYEQKMPLKQLASISTPDATTIAISPWDASNLEAIEKALRDNKELGLNAVSDGKTIHVTVPPLTTESREQLVKQVNEKVENCNISLRNIRHEVLKDAKARQTAGELSEDEYHLLDKQLAAQIDEVKKRTDELAESKKEELRAI